MYRSLVTLRYAKALFLQAEEEGITDRVLEDSRRVLKILDDNPELYQAFYHPAILSSKKRRVIDQIFQDRVSPVMLNFLHLLLQNKREFYLHDIFRNFRDLYNEARGIKTVELVTALQLGEEEKEAVKRLIRESFHAQKVDFSEKIDPGILGGFIIQIEDQLLDASVRRQLETIKRTLLNKNNHIH
jgi:F-type H+-transporting ATPase subunit delta